MRRHILLFITLCIAIAARGQTIAVPDSLRLLPPTTAKALRYWIDDDAGSVQILGGMNGTHSIDVSSLTDGLHTIHCQIIDSEDELTAPYSAIFLKMDASLSASTASTLRYWFDDDTNVNTCNANVGTQVLDVSMLLDGLHTLHYQVVDTEGQVSYLASDIFLKMDALQGSGNVTAERLICWFDDEEETMSVDMVSGVMSLDASGLTDGLHTVHYLVACSDGSVTSAYSSIFLRMNIDILATTARSLRYWFDNDTAVTITEIVQGTQTIDASHLTDGLHTVHYQIVDESGQVTSPVSGIFLKMAEGSMAATTAQSLRYWFDNDTDVKTTSVAGGTQSIDVSDLPAGLHTLHYQLVDSNGQLTSICSGIFLKMFDNILEAGQNRITQYKYWLNNNSQAVQTVTLDNATNPYTLIALLPMQHEPLRSSCFHFEIKDGKPMMYAKNDFHIRFHDAAGYWVDDSRQFTDYSVSKEIAPVGNLQATQTFPKVAANDVRWYTMQVAPGDTAAFRLSQPATVQVFAPSGAEVFKTSEAASVKWGGIHTWEDGTYYLAVHDVTGSQSTMKLEYMRMDKYDIVDWDVHRVGNGGCSTITFKGNGFRDLYAVDLVIAPGDTIHSVDVSHDSDAETAVTFDFTAATLGNYNAVFHFTEEDKPVANVVTVEEAVDIELATDVTFPSSFLRGTSTTYTIKITNKGNMTAYAVPLEMHIFADKFSDISDIKYDGYISNTRLTEVLQTDSLDEDALDVLLEYSNNVNGLSSFVQYHDSIANKDYALSYAIITIPPKSSRQIMLSIKSTSAITYEAYVNKDWFPICTSNGSVSFSKRRTVSARESMCCMRTKVECVADIVVNFISPILPPGANCLTSLSKTGLETLYDVWCSDGANMSERFDNYLKSEGQNLVGRLVGSIIDCVTGYFSHYVDGLEAKRKAAFDSGNFDLAHSYSKEILDAKQSWKYIITNIGTGIMHGLLGKDCIDAFTQPLPGCPPNPDGGGGKSTPQPPSDPNDIYGYLSEAGSKFIADSVARVNYTIEFENDTTFATAAAHTIVIKDTLDSRYLDLAKFMPTGIRIGEHETFLDEADVVTKNNVTSFVKTIDMRPEINAIAQMDGTFSHSTGIAQWTFQSLDPMTMEPTDDLMQGILPVNYNGTSGIGEVMFEVGMKQGKADGTQINNRAGIVFDYEETILTPTWTNIVDAVAPSSVIDNSWMVNDSTLRITADGFDERSGVWKYTWYVQAGENAPWWNEGETESPQFDYHIFEGIDYGFCVLATDSAGNVEQKVITRERGFKTYGQDFEDGISPLPTSPEEEENVNGKWLNGKWYDLSGRRHDEPQENQVNIVGRKKILFRKGEKVKR